MFDPDKRRRVMTRSIKLGHCICDPRKGCPCDLFKENNVCLCAGERLEEVDDQAIALTKLVENAGCASKINQSDLKIALAGLPAITDPRVLVSADTCDDAGIFRISDDLALVQSVDVFTPSVDDPYVFGQIAAANSVSDIYAMGGTPLTALSIIGFPIETVSHKVMNAILRGGIDKLHEAGVVVVGGHSIKDAEVKFGFAVTGTVHPDRIITNDAARPGDALVLTKPLGTGVIGFAAQLGKAPVDALKDISRSMTALNRIPAEVAQELGIRTATDVTGFGFLGHLSEIVVQSGVTAVIDTGQVPVFDGVLDLIQDSLISGAVERNREFSSQFVEVEEDVSSEVETVLYDPQTSGGLLMAVPENEAESLVTRLRERGISRAVRVGRITETSEGRIILKP